MDIMEEETLSLSLSLCASSYFYYYCIALIKTKKYYSCLKASVSTFLN